MLSNCDEIHAIPPKTSNQWSTQTDEMIEDHHIKVSSMAAASPSSSVRVMEKPGQDLLQQQQQQHQALKCPRCDSSNTKFCYYNNYNLSQPRHFCKACKRYWTRGGTLRNVPVGGGCRKNKRLKRHAPAPGTTSSTTSTTTTATATATASPSPSSQTQISPLFYGSSCDVMNLVPFPGFSGSRASSSGYDVHHELNAGLGDDNGYRIQGFGSNSNAFLSSYNSIFGSSLLSSSLMQGLGAPVEELQVRGNSNSRSTVMASKEVKADEQGQGQGRSLEWNIGGACQDNHQQMEHAPLSSDPSLYWNTPTALGAWISDQSNSIAPNSLTSLI